MSIGVVLGVVPVAAAQEAPTWLTGCWEARRGSVTIEERWTDARGGLMMGVGRTVRDGRAVAWEWLRIAVEDGRAVYHAYPSGQSETRFPAAAVTDSTARFENPDHDFPQRIAYRRTGTDTLTVDVGLLDGSRGFPIVFGRVSCQSAP